MVLPDGWSEHFDEASGQYFYYNQHTDVTSWDIPSPNQEDDNNEGHQNPSNSDWNLERTDNGEVYYANMVTGEVSWDPPAGWKLNSRDDLEKVAIVDLNPSELPENWEEVLGDREDEVYYYNHVTQESQWEKPQCLEVLENQEQDAQARGSPDGECDSSDADEDSSGSDDSSITHSIIDHGVSQEKDIYAAIKDPKTVPTVEELSKLVESYSLETYAESLRLDKLGYILF